MRAPLNDWHRVYNRTNPFNLDVTGDPEMEAAYKLTHTHLGADFSVPVGTPLYAPADGTLIAVINSVPKGKCAIYCFTDTAGKEWGMEVAHMSSVEKLGDYKEGSVIGRTGRTGTACFGPHAHIVLHAGARVTKNYSEISKAGQTGWQNGRAKIQEMIANGTIADPYAFFSQATPKICASCNQIIK